MIVKNDTWIPTEDLEALIAFAKPAGRAPELIAFWCARDTKGLARKHVATGVSRVDIFVGPAPMLEPAFNWKWTARRMELDGLEEVLVYTIAHELQHCAQDMPPSEEWTERRERNADAHACRVLRRWRRRVARAVLTAAAGIAIALPAAAAQVSRGRRSA